MSDKAQVPVTDQTMTRQQPGEDEPSRATGTTAAREQTDAERAAADNLTANIAALSLSQPRQTHLQTLASPDVEWVFGTDGSLTARMPDGSWLGGCSLPRRVAAGQFRNVKSESAVVAVACPPHAATVAALLACLSPAQAVVAIVPSEHGLAVLLRCADFSADVAAGRLWFVGGDAWQQQLRGILADRPGLPAPGQVMRVTFNETNNSPEQVTGIAQAIQQLAREVGEARRAAIESIKASWHTGAPLDRRPVCIVAPGRFQLWHDTGLVLEEVFGQQATATSVRQLEVRRITTDRPTDLAPLALVQAAQRADAVVAADYFRADSPGLLPGQVPWITWVTRGRVPAFAAAAPGDGLIVASDVAYRAAIDAGWPALRIRQASWPAAQLPPAPAGRLLLLADTVATTVPQEIHGQSSLTWLWEAIDEELHASPSALDVGIERYLTSRLAKIDLPADRLPKELFVERLILPAYAQGIAAKLRRLKVPFAIRGAGWQSVGFSEVAGPAVADRSELLKLLCEAPALVDAWPVDWPHPGRHAGRAVLCPATCADPTLKAAADKLARGGAAGTPPAYGPFHAGLVLDLLEQAVPDLQD